jgi:predicted alpha/beta superfamily hydrolase
MKIKLLIIPFFLFITVNVLAQDGYLLVKDSLQSKTLIQNRKLNVYLPEGYSNNKAKFPVIYVLDAPGRDQHIVPTARFLSANNKMPQAIVIGVTNIDRNHDFLPDSTKSTPTGGGADNFLKFFREELIPYIDGRYKADTFRVLVGHSFGGVFAMHAFLNDPDLFEGYIAIDPSFWYKNKIQVTSTQAEFLKSKNWKKFLFITGREGSGMKEMGVDAMEKLLKTSAPAQLTWKVTAYPNEDHGSVPFKSAYDGLRFIFDSGVRFNVFPLACIIPDGTWTYAYLLNNNPNLRYTTDGSEPTEKSKKCPDKIKISKPCTLKVKNISDKFYVQPVITRIFRKGNFMNGIDSTENLKPGLKYTYYEGVWDSLPDFSVLIPKKTGITGATDFSFAARKDSFAVQFEGYLHITKKALYDIWITSDDGSKVWFNNELILSNDGLHAANLPVVTALPLNPGYYPIVIRYFENTGEESFTLGTMVNDGNAQPVPKEMFFHEE